MFIILMITSLTVFAAAAVICNIRDSRRENVQIEKMEGEVIRIEKKAA